jgi:crotonobetainyl-CoA:carnitine CoA-transferase CaiB-like acyl-CoA transferase
LHSTNEVVAELQALDIPASQIKTIADIAADDDLRSSSRLVDVDHARLGTVPLVRGPIRISTGGEEDEFSPLAQPDLGEHTEELLAAAGFSSQEISNWTTNGVVHQAIKEAS